MTYQEYEAEVDRELARQNTSRKTIYVFDLPTRQVMDAYYQKISASEFAADVLRSQSTKTVFSDKETQGLFF